MQGIGIILFYALIIMYCIYVWATFTSKRPEDKNLFLPLAVHAIAVLLFCIIPLVFYICKGGFAGMTFLEIIRYIPELAFDESTGVPYNVVSFSFFIAGFLGIVKFSECISKKRKGIK
jgi:hypothetical protein